MILVYSITPIHVGAGRAVGIVDLPIQRDALGYPVIFSSSFKGALKSYCAENKIKDGRIDCSSAPLCCCAFGSEPIGSETETGILTLTDLIPFAVPVPAINDVYLYLTSPYLLRKIKDILEAERYKSENENLNAFYDIVSSILDVLKGKQNDMVSLSKEDEDKEIFVYDKVKKIKIKDEKGLKLLKDLGTLASDIEDKLVVKVGGDDRYLFDKATLKVTRNRISLDTKTVEEGALWTEEYLPEGTIFVGGYLITDRKNSFCNSSPKEVVNELKQKRFSNGTFYLSLGGKETIGKGLVKVVWW